MYKKNRYDTELVDEWKCTILTLLEQLGVSNTRSTGGIDDVECHQDILLAYPQGYRFYQKNSFKVFACVASKYHEDQSSPTSFLLQEVEIWTM